MPSTDQTSRTANRPSRAAEHTVYVLGGGPLGVAVTRRLRADGREVVLIDESADGSDDAVHRGDPTDALTLAEAGMGPDSVAIVATPSDSRNLLAAQLVRARFDVDRVVVLTNHPERVDAMADGGHDPVCATDALAAVLVDRL